VEVSAVLTFSVAQLGRAPNDYGITRRRFNAYTGTVRALRMAVVFIVALYFGLAVIAYFMAERMIFLPPPAGYRESARVIKLRTGAGDTIAAMHFPNPEARYTILFSHGNAEDIGHNEDFFGSLVKQGWAVFAYDYPGYGLSTGTPTERSAYTAIDAAYAYMRNDLRIPPEQIVIYGRSVGSGVSVDLAAREPVAGLILESPMTSIIPVVTRVPVFPFDYFRNISKIKKINAPLLVMHGRADRIIHVRHGEALFTAANEPKRSLFVEGADHNDFMWIAGERYWSALRDYQAWLEQLPKTRAVDR
jgi:alpha-beta hydrolase superfamily lysophospholipase